MDTSEWEAKRKQERQFLIVYLKNLESSVCDAFTPRKAALGA